MTNKKSASVYMMLSISLGTFMSALDSSVVNIAVPVIQNHFNTELSAVEWVVTSYLLVVSSMLLTFGRLSDLYGHKRVYLTGFGLFTAGSLLCSISVSIGMLVMSRIFQALGAGMMFATNNAIITDNVEPGHRGKAFSFIAVAVAAATCTGPVAGGMLASFLGWQSIFYINIPLGLVGMFLAWKHIPEDRERRPAPFDVAGAVLVFAALFLILLPLNLAGGGTIGSGAFIGMLAAGLALIGLFVFHERRTPYPMLRLGLFRNRVFTGGLLAAVFNYMSQFIMVFLMPQYYQVVLGMSAAMSGLFYIPMPLATILVAPLSGSFSDRHDSRVLGAAGLGLMAVGLLLLSFINVDTPYWYIVAVLLLAGVGSGMFQSPNNSAVMGAAPPEHLGAASSTLAMMRNVGMVLGVALGGALFNSGAARASAAYAVSGMAGERLQDLSFVQGIHVAFLAAAALSVLAMVASLARGKIREAAPAGKEDSDSRP